MENLTTGIGTILYASATTPTTFDEAAYSALTWVEVGEITDIPEYGGTSEVVTHTPLKTGVQEKFHGAENAGSLQIPLAYDSLDAGQDVLRDARDNKRQIAFKIVYPKVLTASAEGATDYMVGKVFGFTRSASTNGVVAGNVNVEFDTKPLAIAEA